MVGSVNCRQLARFGAGNIGNGANDFEHRVEKRFGGQPARNGMGGWFVVLIPFVGANRELISAGLANELDNVA